jgi:3-hydroxyisobutyrate dehydrogenase-like beta-hydroxyacid dehydrogenase
MVSRRPLDISLIGYGEVGRILAEDLRQQRLSVTAWDIKLQREEGNDLREHAARHGVRLMSSAVRAVAVADLVISAVTANQTVAVARDCAQALQTGAFFLDLNSASPHAKVEAAQVIEAAGGRYVEAAVMTSVPPHRIKVPMLLGGPHAAALLPLLAQRGFSAKVTSTRLGVASATKMCRSVVVKGFEAMVIESFTTARAWGVEDAVIASLKETFPGIDWERQASYFFQRVIEHGRRRADEAREVAVTVRDAGLDPWSAAGTAERQDWMADLAEAGLFGARGEPEFARSADWRSEADRILSRSKGGPGFRDTEQ